MRLKINFLQMPVSAQANLSWRSLFGIAGWLTVKYEFISVETHPVKLAGKRILVD